MKDIYSDVDHWSTAYLWNVTEPFPEVDIHRPFSILTGIEVNQAFRRNGYASRLLSRICEDADEERVILVLSIQPDGSRDSLTYAELLRWYSGRGFRVTHIPGVMKREPQ